MIESTDSATWRFVIPSATEWWQSLRWAVLLFTLLVGLTLAGSFVSYEQVLISGHPWLPRRSCTGCLFCGMTRSFCALSAGRLAEGWKWNKGGPLLYTAGWLWLSMSSGYVTARLRRQAWMKRVGRTFSEVLVPTPARLVFLILASLLCTSCEHCPDWDVALKNETPTSVTTVASSSIKTTKDLVVYLDTSGSMSGYVSRDGQTIFGKTLRELRYATGTFGEPDMRVVVRHVGADVGPFLPDMDLTTSSQDPGIFRDGETNLAGALNSFRLGVEARAMNHGKKINDAGDGAVAKNIGEGSPVARFHVLVTDGVQSTRTANGKDCTFGSDQFCIRQEIGELLKEGWGGCVLGIRADFHGRVYSEVSGASIPYESNSNDPSSYRPFYLYIFSPDPQALNSLIQSLKERLRPLVPDSGSIRELNLSFPYTTDIAGFEITVSKDSRDMIRRSIAKGGPPPRFAIQVDLDTERSGAKPFEILVKIPWSSHALDTGNLNELTQLVTWKAVPIYPATDTAGKRFSELTVTPRGADETGRISLQASAGFLLGPQTPSCRFYRLEGRLNLNQATPEWIRSWSTDLDTKPEHANRTLNLETALLGLWNNSTAKDQIVAQAYLRVGP